MRFRLGLLLAAPFVLDPSAASASGLPASAQDRTFSEVTAYNWAATGTLGPVLAGTALAAFGGGAELTTRAGVGMILVGLGLGPSMGQVYAGSYLHGVAASTLRVGGGVLVVAGAAASVASQGCEENDTCRDRGLPLALAGTLAYFGGVAYSLVETHFAVRRRASPSRPALSLTPTLHSLGPGHLGPGLLAQVRF